MPAPRCSTCGQRRAQCACPPPIQDTLALAVREQDARVLARSTTVEDACRLLRACATLPTELPLLLQTAVEEALTTIRQVLLPPQIPKGPRGRRPDFETYEAFLTALDDGLRRFPRRKKLRKDRFASYVLVQTPDGHKHGLSERALTYNLDLYHVDWKAFKDTYKNSKKSRH